MNREEKLRCKFNNFLSPKLSLENEDYYGKLDTKDFMDLKAFLSDVNNIITLKLTLGFIETLALIFGFSESEKATVIEAVQAVSPNANGFDIEIREPVKLVAEVKGNIPVKNGAVFGAAQKKGILKDLHSLKNGKTKSVVLPDDFYKFMVLPDTEMTKVAMDKLTSSIKDDGYKFEVISGRVKQLSTDTIYVVFVKIR